MALAWNAGWVNSPRGFKSRILRTQPGARPAATRGRAPGHTIEEAYGPHRCGALARVVLLAAGVLYFFFVLPRTFELLGETSHTLGTALRIVTAALIGLAALPVLLTLLRTRRPELGTPHWR